MIEIPGAQDMSKASVLAQNFKIAIIGGPGSGKTWLAASCATKDEPAFHFDFDGRNQSIAGKPNVTSKSYLLMDAKYPAMMPMAWQTFLQDLMTLERAQAKGELPYKWFIYDSATLGSTLCMNYMLYNSASLRREISVNNVKTFIPKSFDAYKAEVAEVQGAWQRLMCLGNLIVCFHTDAEKAPDSTPDNPKYTGKKTVTPPRYADLLALFNDQWMIEAVAPGKYQVQTQPNFMFTAKNTMFLDQNEEPDIRKMMAKYMTKAKSLTPTVQL